MSKKLNIYACTGGTLDKKNKGTCGFFFTSVFTVHFYLSQPNPKIDKPKMKLS